MIDNIVVSLDGSELAERALAFGEAIDVVCTTRESYPGERIIEHERRGYVQMVVMATSGRSGVSRVVLGSVAERVLKLGRSPVVTVHSVADAGAK